MAEPAKKLETVEEKPKEEEKKALVSVGAAPIGGLIPQTFEQMWRLSTIMAASGMMPKGMDKTESVFVAVQMGLEVGLSPMQAVQSIAVINNRPAIWGDGALGLVRASGELEEFQESFTGEEFKDDWTAHCKVKRAGYEPRENSFSLAEAKAAGLYPPSDKFSPWGKYTRRMLQMRARSWALRDEFTDVLKGLQIREEQADIVLAPTAEGAYAMPEVATDDSRLAAFEEMVAGIENGERIEEYITHLADHFGITAEKIKAEAIESEATWQDFVATYKGWIEKHSAKDHNRDLIDTFWKLQKTGFASQFESFCKAYEGWSARVQAKFDQKCDHMAKKYPEGGFVPPWRKGAGEPKPETPPETPGEEEPPATGQGSDSQGDSRVAGMFQANEVLNKFFDLGYKEEQFLKYALSLGKALPADPEKNRNTPRYELGFIDGLKDRWDEEVRKFEDWVATK